MQFDQMKRRDVLTLLGGAAVACPLAARAQQPAMPVVGFLDSRLPEGLADRLRGFRQGLKETSYSEGETVTVEYRWRVTEKQLSARSARQGHRGRLHIAVQGGSGRL